MLTGQSTFVVAFTSFLLRSQRPVHYSRPAKVFPAASPIPPIRRFSHLSLLVDPAATLTDRLESVSSKPSSHREASDSSVCLRDELRQGVVFDTDVDNPGPSVVDSLGGAEDGMGAIKLGFLTGGVSREHRGEPETRF